MIDRRIANKRTLKRYRIAFSAAKQKSLSMEPLLYQAQLNTQGRWLRRWRQLHQRARSERRLNDVAVSVYGWNMRRRIMDRMRSRLHSRYDEAENEMKASAHYEQTLKQIGFDSLRHYVRLRRYKIALNGRCINFLSNVFNVMNSESNAVFGTTDQVQYHL
jgi:hypothetical protein